MQRSSLLPRSIQALLIISDLAIQKKTNPTYHQMNMSYIRGLLTHRV